MQNQELESQDAVTMTEEQWDTQRLVAAELRRLREASGMTRTEMCRKMGLPYTEELIAQYEDGGIIPMEIWPVFDMVKALHADINDLVPERLKVRRGITNGYSNLNEESRQVADRVIGALLQTQAQAL